MTDLNSPGIMSTLENKKGVRTSLKVIDGGGGHWWQEKDIALPKARRFIKRALKVLRESGKIC